MLNKTEWHQAGRIILQVYSGDISFAEMQEGWQQTEALIALDNGDLPVHLVLDFTQRRNFSPDLLKLQTMRQLFELCRGNPRLGWFLAVQPQPNPVMLFSSTVAARLVGRKFRLAATLEEALRYLSYTDSSLVQSSQNP